MIQAWKDWKTWLAAPFVITHKDVLIVLTAYLVHWWNPNWF